ncbi:Zinc finger protein ZPR1, partial [Stegodyphus mimosarum]
MATTCDACGHKTNEVKSGSGIEPYGVRFILKIETDEDLTRDILKSDTCAISIKELELEVGAAAFGSRYTTVEGILSTIKDELKLSNPLATGDSGDPLLKEKMESFLTKLDEIISGKWKVTLVLDDPCGNSYVQSIHFPNSDTNLTVEKYKRSQEQDEELGLLD